MRGHRHRYRQGLSLCRVDMESCIGGSDGVNTATFWSCRGVFQAVLTRKQCSVHSGCQHGKQLRQGVEEGRFFPVCRVDAESAFGALCVSTRLSYPAERAISLPCGRRSGVWCVMGVNTADGAGRSSGSEGRRGGAGAQGWPMGWRPAQRTAADTVTTRRMAVSWIGGKDMRTNHKGRDTEAGFRV